MDKISFIIRLKNGERYIGHCIQSILDHFSKPEIIIVNNNCDDEGMEIVNLFPRKFYNIHILDIDKYTPGLALNNAIRKSSHDTVGILSSHCEITQGNINIIQNHFNEANCFGVFGVQIPIYKGKKIHRNYIWENFVTDNIVKNPIETVPEKRYFFHNAFSFINKNHWKKISFCEEMAGKEDRHFAKKMIDSGYHFYLDPNLKCNHHFANNATFKGIG